MRIKIFKKIIIIFENLHFQIKWNLDLVPDFETPEKYF